MRCTSLAEEDDVRRMRTTTVLAAGVLALGGVSACSDSEQDEVEQQVEDGAEQVEEGVEEGADEIEEEVDGG